MTSNQDIVDQSDKFVGDLDHLFQEGVVFTVEERHQLKENAHTVLAIINDAFFKVEGDSRTPVQKAFDKADESIGPIAQEITTANYVKKELSLLLERLDEGYERIVVENCIARLSHP